MVFDKFREWRINRHAYAKSWKERTGGKVLGYFCTYVPEEILYAAGVLPVRIFGSHEPQDVTEPHIFNMFCPFCRDCLAQGLKGRYDYLDGIMIAQSCLHIRQAFASWQKHIPAGFDYYLCMPNNVQSPRALPFLTGELLQLKQSIEQWIGETIADDNLDNAIDIYNRNRGLMRAIYDLRKADVPPLSGEDAIEMVLSSQVTDKAEHNVELMATLDELPNRGSSRTPGIRLMILGSEFDHIAFINMVESCDATIVIDDHCTGSRYFWNDVRPDHDRIVAIAARYIDRIPCPSKDWMVRTRVDHILKLGRDWNVDGAIIIQQKFCDPHELDNPSIRKALHDIRIKTLALEFDTTFPIGQYKTRVEAFLEILGEDDMFP